MKPRRERLALRAFALLLRLYPERHRRAFGAQMLQTFTDEYRDLVAQGGKAGLRFWLAMAGNVVTSSAREHIMALRAKGLLPLLFLLGGAVLVGGSVLLARPLAVAAVLLILLGAVLAIALRRRGQRAGPGRWWRPWLIAGLLVIPVLLFARAQAQSANTNAQCTAAHTPSTTPPATTVTAADYLALGDYDFDRGDCVQAIAAYSQAIALNPQYAEAYNNRAYTYMMQADYARALPDLDTAIRLRPTYVHALMNRGDIYNFNYQIDRQKAIADYDRVIAQGPTAYHDTSVCGHRWLALHNGWHLSTLAVFVQGPDAGCRVSTPQ